MIKELNSLEEINAASLLCWGCFIKFQAPTLTDEGVETFKQLVSYEMLKKKHETNELELFGFFQEGNLVGIIALKEHSHISLFFVKEEYHNVGIGKKLMSFIVERCKSRQCLKLTLNSSIYANEVYKKFGFISLNSVQELNGIIYIPMELKL
ncbi:MAG: GNAT family N-acetyltransferase [Fusobacteria bacterium]|nr:GNAT family N-acetyltransferase [Fusobacteriota bacterium]